MKQTLIEIANILWDVPHMDKDLMIGLLNPLDTEEEAQTYLDYLKSNKDNEELMRIDVLINKSLQIGNYI